MRIKLLRESGFTLVEIMIVVAIIGLLAAIAVPNFVKARTTAQMNACINNLRQIDGAIQQWALDSRAADNAPVTMSDVLPYLKNTVLCPAAGSDTDPSHSYSVTTVDSIPTCLIKPETHKLLGPASSTTTTSQ